MQPNPNAKVEPETRIEPERSPLDELVESVRRDAEVKPQAYARETIVPEGGE